MVIIDSSEARFLNTLAASRYSRATRAIVASRLTVL